MWAKVIVENDDGIDEEELRKAVAHMKSENEEEHKRNIKDMGRPGKIKMQQLQQI